VNSTPAGMATWQMRLLPPRRHTCPRCLTRRALPIPPFLGKAGPARMTTRTGRLGRPLAAVVALVAAIAALLLLAYGASPSHAAGSCTATAGTTTCAFGPTGAEDTFVVPAGANSVHIVATGAPGAVGNVGDTAGRGARVSADLAVSPLARPSTSTSGALQQVAATASKTLPVTVGSTVAGQAGTVGRRCLRRAPGIEGPERQPALAFDRGRGRRWLRTSPRRALSGVRISRLWWGRWRCGIGRRRRSEW
jgi:hypothetical protein